VRSGATYFEGHPIPNPNFGTVALTDNTATSDYKALQVRLQRPLSRGWPPTLSCRGTMHPCQVPVARERKCCTEEKKGETVVCPATGRRRIERLGWRAWLTPCANCPKVSHWLDQ
jgi:hypothetical protein